MKTHIDTIIELGHKEELTKYKETLEMLIKKHTCGKIIKHYKELLQKINEALTTPNNL